MPEKVLPLPLSGEEIRKAILDRLSQRLEKDGFLNPVLCYDYFSAKVTIEIRAHDCGRAADVDISETVQIGEEPEAAEGQTGEFEIEPQPPNTERVETGQPVPVLSRSKDGQPEVKKVKYKRTAAEKVQG
jgi:hypothetical protein